MKEFLKPAFNILKSWKIFIIFLGLGIFALYVGIRFILFVIEGKLNLKSLYEVVVFSFTIFVISFFVAKFYPERFINWNVSWIKDLKKENLINKLIVLIILLILISPLTNLFMSLGLSLFILSFIKPDINLLWQKIVIDSETIYDFLDGIAILPFDVFIFLFIVIILPMIFFEKILKKGNFLKRIGQIWFFIFLASPPILLKEFPLIQTIQEMIIKISSKVVQFIIGALPLCWFYELFIGSVTKKKGKEIFN